MKHTRRQFLAASASLTLGAVTWPGCSSSRPEVSAPSPEKPWYRRTFRWGQTNITEADAEDYDIDWWRAYWKRTLVQGVIVNAGGIVAYYPSEFPLQYRAPTLGKRDLFDELSRAAHADGLTVLARMDSSRAHQSLYDAHPDWFALDAAGMPHKTGDLFITCVNGPYYDEYLPGILSEIAKRYGPEGFTDNSWSGLGREAICYCDNCKKRFRDRSGRELPRQRNWDDPGYREWILWNYARRLELWDQNNRLTQEAGGRNCLWIGMNSGSISAQCRSFRDYKGICQRAEIILLDHQARSDDADFAQNADAGQLVHSLLGWNKLVPESMAMYQAGRPTFRKTSRPEPEARLWMLEGFAGGLQPWWHHVGARQEDRRQFLIPETIYRWHEANQQFLTDREPIAAVGLVWSQQNLDFFGRDRANERVELPWLGWTRALVRARIQFLPVHADEVGASAAKLSVLILPNFGGISEAQASSLRRFVQNGGALIATGRSSLYDEWGQPRSDFLLADLLGCHYLTLGRQGEAPRELRLDSQHSYLRIPPGSTRHQILAGFDRTDVLPFGGWLGDVIPAGASQVLLTYVPSFPIYPPETSWMREPRTRVPALVVNPGVQNGRVAFLIADVDRRYALDRLPDHGRLLANLVRWASRDRLPLQVEGPGLIDCRLYQQPGRLILHLVNLTNTGGLAPVDELIPVGPIKITLGFPPAFTKKRVHLLVGRAKASFSFADGHATLLLPTLLDHQVVVLD